MPEEQMKDDSEVAKAPDLFEAEPAPEDVAAPKEEPPKGEPLAKEKQEPIIPLEEFWSGVRTGTFVTAKAGHLDTPSRAGEKTSINGNVSFDAEGIKASYPFEAYAVKVLDENPASCRLEINVKPMMKLVSAAIQKYKDHGEMFKGEGYYRAVKEAIPGIFEKVFQAIKQNSKQINWMGASTKHDEDAITAVITLTHANELEPYLDALLDKSAVKSMGTEILSAGSGGTKHKYTHPVLREMDAIRSFVKKIPEDRFKWEDIGMFVAMPLDEVKQTAGADADKLMKALEAMPAGEQGTKSMHDTYDFKCIYYPKEGFVLFENKRLSNYGWIKKIKTVKKNNAGPNFYQNLADKAGVSLEQAKKWWAGLFDHLTPDAKEKAEKAVGSEEGMKKVAYPNTAWAGPTLEQVGALVGPDKAMLASEWASSLADKLNYTSYPPTFPTLVGGPGDIKKLAALALTDAQRALVEKYREPSIALMNGLLESHPIYDEEDEGGSDFVKPESEEVAMLAEDALLGVVENLEGTSKPDEEDFMNELKSRLWTTLKRVQQHHQTAWPSTRVDNPEDVQILKERSYDPVKDQPEALMEKKAFHEGDAIQLNEEYHHPELRGRMGKICDIKGDIYMCPEHGPEPVVRYLVDLGTDAPQPMAWVVDGEFNSAGSTN